MINEGDERRTGEMDNHRQRKRVAYDRCHLIRVTTNQSI